MRKINNLLSSQRIAILVDSENLEITVNQCFPSQKRTHTPFPDWKKIIPLVVGGRTLVRNIYYKRRERSVSQKFRQMWEGELGGEIKQPIKSADPYIIVDAITVCEKVDVVVILAGDKDYLPLLWYLKSRGCKVEVASFAAAAAEAIKQAAEKYYHLDKRHTVNLQRTVRRTGR